ncbi:MAG: Clp protease [Spirochaetes bacterium GWD1_61_31]|nr:MAG: Clp protease [Spirochaetes bacterium GWB1_60_80]OHD34833.1 MAG: Clp protease [Spirochaetes bacterium GWD1_61_31]OHD46679.1 MAG: Clp protease [Spirochaetes bacterium GWE1_60_18]OHD61555.1 MAG: Clp protease [Spirochaetes bacterium GWF1_60_12]HAP44204.1 Clp protease [Spirochaetaceae bacterium]
MFKGLTKRAQYILTTLAQEEARQFHSSELNPEHVLLALLRAAEGNGFNLMQSLKMDLAELKIELERAAMGRKSGFLLGDAPLSRRLKSMLETAAEEARLMNGEYIGTEHLLLAAAREATSVFESFLGRYNINYDHLCAALRMVIAPQPGSKTVQHRSAAEAAPSARKASASVSTPMLDEHSRDLTARAREDKLDPVLGRERETSRLVRVLSRRTKNNPVLIGDPGVGKTAIVEGLALRIARADVPEGLQNKRLVTLDMASIVAGTKYRGEFEERLKRIMKEIQHAGNIILFIDELHTLIGAGSAEGTIDASNMLKPALSRGELQCIGATTLDEYRRFFEKDTALERRFQTVLVEEPDLAETITILNGIKDRYQKYHGVQYSAEAVRACAVYAQRYISERAMPDKAIDVLDEAGARKKIAQVALVPELSVIEDEIRRLTEEKLSLVSSQNYERAADVRDRVRTLRGELESLRQRQLADAGKGAAVVGYEDVRAVVSEITGIPLDRVDEGETNRLVNLELALHKRVVGQDVAIARLASAVRRSRAGIADPRRPLGSFIFLGPTGVGKTLLAKTLAENLFGSQDALFRIDMSDFMEKHNAARLVGAPPGYVGYDQGGMLTERIRRKPYSVVLFDEIEKAHPDVFNLLLQLLEEGELRDNLGHTVSFRNCVIIMTSNAGTRDIARGNRLGFTSGDQRFDFKTIEAAALAELKRLFNPEFINRVDEVVVFHPLDRKQVTAILDLELDGLRLRLAEKGISLDLDAKAIDWLVEHGYDTVYGARPLRRLITRSIEDPVAISIINGECPAGAVVRIRCKAEELQLKVQLPSRLKPEAVAGARGG